MGLPDDFSGGLLKLIWEAAQNRNPNTNSIPDNAGDLPLWLPPQQPRLPLSFAGPDLTAGISASSPSRPPPGPTDPSASTGLSWLPGDRSADPPIAQPPTRAPQNVTAQALRMKGVPEADIAAAIGNPEVMRQLIIQHYVPGSARAPIRAGYEPYGGGASGGSLGDSRQRIDPDISGLDGARARRDAPAWDRFMSGDPTGLSAGDINLYRADANTPAPLNGPSGLFFHTGYTGDPAPEPGPTRPQPTPPTRIAAGGPRCDGHEEGCHEGGSFGTNGLYSVDNKNLCESCAVKTLRIGNLGAIQRTKILGRYIR
jgi:hypothetical protein